jgi:hypothetical protein
VGWSKAERRAWARGMRSKMAGKRRAMHRLAHVRDIGFGGKDHDAKRRAVGGLTVRMGNEVRARPWAMETDA